MTCAKRIVVCGIHTADGMLFIGRNDCATPQKVCPREPGEGYEKCKTVCDQFGHAEMQALALCIGMGRDPRGASVHIMGHYHACEQCCAALRDAGVASITIYPQETILRHAMLAAADTSTPN